MNIFGTIGHAVIGDVLPLLGTVIAGFVVALLKKKLKSLGIEVSQQQEDRLKQLVRDGIRLAEEQSKRAAKDGRELSGGEKRDIAVAYVVEAAPQMPIDKVDIHIDTQLPKIRAVNFGPNPGLPGGGRR